MIWLKRIAPFLLLIALYYGYTYYNAYALEKTSAEQNKYALVTAQTWIASVKFRNEPDCYLEYRDSILAQKNLAPDSVKKYIELFSDEAELLGNLTSLIKTKIDSLIIVQDSVTAIDNGMKVFQDSLLKIQQESL